MDNARNYPSFFIKAFSALVLSWEIPEIFTQTGLSTVAFIAASILIQMEALFSQHSLTTILLVGKVML